MSFVMNALASYQAVLGLNNANYATMQNNQRRTALANSASPSFAGSQSLLNQDKRMEMQNATNGFMAQAYQVQLDSMEAAKKRQVEGFNYFA